MEAPHPDIARILIPPDQIRARLREIALELQRDYAGEGALYLVGILKGAFIFLADLTRELTVPHIVDFMALSSYGKSATSTGAVRIVMDLREPINGRHVLIVEDILDTGNTLRYLSETLLGRKPASLRSCVLLRKKRPGPVAHVDYLGFEIPDVWVVGYGLDYADSYRTLPYIAELKPEIYQGRG
ncbi:MAG TPA: hypoxanthine phosphoribosyltransferase [Anaerolineales bacterium]|nr:hypoxanthine phosphoribosyltransferase [Anaerolineales bacterium]